VFIAISAVGAFCPDDGGESWQPINRGLHCAYIPDPTAKVGHRVHHVAVHPSRPETLCMTRRRRPLIRFFSFERDLSHCPRDKPLPVTNVD